MDRYAPPVSERQRASSIPTLQIHEQAEPLPACDLVKRLETRKKSCFMQGLMIPRLTHRPPFDHGLDPAALFMPF